MFTLTTSLQHSIGSPRHSSQIRRNKRYPNRKGRGKIVTLCKWNRKIASVVSLCICDSHSPSCLFLQISLTLQAQLWKTCFSTLWSLGSFGRRFSFPSSILSSPPAFSLLLCQLFPLEKGSSAGSSLPMPCSAWSTPFLPLDPCCFLSPISHDCKASETLKVISWARDDLLQNTAPTPNSPC